MNYLNKDTLEIVTRKDLENKYIDLVSSGAIDATGMNDFIEGITDINGQYVPIANTAGDGSPSPTCKRCGCTASELNEYIDMAKEEGMTPDEYLRREEGTYNSETNLFYCTPCYIAVGMPLGKA